MKRFFSAFIFLCIAIFTAFASNSVAQAAGAPYVVISGEVWLNDESGNKLFLLPDTYYARVESMDELSYTITFNGVKGKVVRSSVSVVGYDKEVKGTARTIRLDAKYTVFTEIKLFKRMEDKTEEVLFPTNESFTYLGTYPTDNGTYYYVTYGGKFGYIFADFTDTPIIDVEPFRPDADEEQPNQEEKNDGKKETTPLGKIIVISSVSVVGVVLLIVLFFPKKGGKKRKYYYS